MNSSSKPRIISLVPSLTEALCHFGLMDCIVGCTSFCVEPKSLRNRVPSVGGTKDARIEDIKALKPTHIIVNLEENTESIIAELKKMQTMNECLVIETFIKTPEDNFTLVESLGKTFSFSEQAQSWIQAQKIELENLRNNLQRLNSFRFAYFIWMNPWMVAGDKTYISSVLELIGGINAISTGELLSERYPAIDAQDERLGLADVMLFSSEPFPFKNRHIDEFRQQSKILRPMIKVDGQALSWYGSRFAETLKYLGRLHAQIEEALH